MSSVGYVRLSQLVGLCETYGPLTLISVGHQWMAPTSMSHISLQLGQREPQDVTNVGSGRSLVVCTNKHGWASKHALHYIGYLVLLPSYIAQH